MKEREILFRGKRVDTGEWVTGASILDCTIENEKSIYIISSNSTGKCSMNECKAINNLKAIMHKIIPETRGEYTGLTDKNGKKIFEGDIVAFTDCTSTENGYSEQYCVGEVVWNNEILSYEVTNRLSAESYEILIECTVIGNIHDNPELSEVKLNRNC